MRIPRSRGALSGVVLVILGLWGGLVPFVGHYFDFVIGSDRAWDFTAGRFWLSIVPAAATVLGGLILIRSAHRAGAGFGAWLALAGGIWFVVGNPVSELWNDGVRQAGPALGGSAHRVAEELGYFYGLGALIVAVAAFALGRLAVRSVRDAELAREAELATATSADRRHRFGRFGRRDRGVAGVPDRDADGVDDRREPQTTA